MHKSRLFELLQKLSPQEHLRLRSFVASPYFSRGEQAGQLIALLDFCLTAIVGNAESGPEKAEAYAAVFPGDAFVAGKLEKRMSALYGLLLQFLVTERYFRPENEPEHQLALAQEFRERKLFDRSSNALNKARQLLEKTAQRDKVYYARRVNLTNQEVNHVLIQPSRMEKVPINENFEALFLYYHSVKQDLAVTLNSVEARYAFSPSRLTKRMVSEMPIPSEFAAASPMLHLSSQYSALLNVSKPDIEAFNRFVQDLRQKEHLLSPHDVKDCWTMARNLPTRWWNIKKDKELLKICLDITLEVVARGYLYHYDKILPYSIETICKTALEVGRFDVAYQFIQEHRGRISSEPDGEPYFHYNMAKYHFYISDLDKAIGLLPHSIPDQSIQMNAKILELQILYELRSDLLPYRMDAFRMFLNRTAPRLHPPLRLGHIRLFLNYFTRIYRCRAGDVQRSETIITQLKSTPQTTEYYWLLKVAAARAILS